MPTSPTRRWSRARRVAEWKDGKLTVWTGTQRPFGVRSELAEAFRIPEDQVRVIVPDTGSGYGGKHTGEAAIEAARLAKAAGKPVKLVWTREEEFTWAYFRPAGVDRGRERRHATTARSPRGSFTTTTPGQLGIRTPVRHPEPADQSFTLSTRRCGRARIARWPPPPITSRAKLTWTNWRSR